MRLRLLAQILSRVATASVTSALALAIAANTTDIQPSYARQDKFFCDREGKTPVTKVRTSRGPETFMRWVVKDFINSGFDPKTRCRAVSARLERYYDNGNLFFTSRNNFNGYPVICIANSKGAPCTSDNILVTLKRGTNAQATLKKIHDFRRGVSSTAINLGGSNQHLSYFDGELYLDVKELVDADSENNTQQPTAPSVEPRF